MWSASQYLKFEGERTQPCLDLVSRIHLEKVHRIIDLGCGPGNSTRILRSRWPEASIIGLDSSSDMIAKARQAEPAGTWIVSDIVDWAANTNDAFDIIFANATFQWVPDHQTLLPRLLARTSGALAFQIPDQAKAPGHQLMRELALSERWRHAFPQLPRWHGKEASFYYDLLSPAANRLHLWETVYIHILPDVDAVAEWYKGTGLRPYLDALNPNDHREFISGFIDGARSIYKPQADGRLLFPFQRLFIVAQK